jgi:hypothetical protein
MDPETLRLLIELVEKIGLLRRDMQQKHDLERYESHRAEDLGTGPAAVGIRSRTGQSPPHGLGAPRPQPGVS